MKARKAELESEIPANWEADHEAFTRVLGAEKKARLSYRRTVDSAYEPVRMLLAAVQDADALAALSSDIDGLAKVITDFEPKQAQEAIKEVESRIGGIVEAGSMGKSPGVKWHGKRSDLS